MDEWRAGATHFMLQTSGSTGVPTLHQLSRWQMQASARATAQAFGLQKNDIAFCCLNTRYIAGIMMLVRAEEIGMKLVVVEPTSNPLNYYSGPIDFAAFVPLQLQTMLDAGLAGRLNSLKTIIVGGAPVGEVLLAKIETLTVSVFATYGMTETVSHVAIRRLNGAERSDCFHFLPDIDFDTDARGCLWVRGAVTNGAVVQTNDVVAFVTPTEFKITGRADNIINSGGIKIQLEKVEAALEKTLGVLAPQSRFFAWAMPDEVLNQKLILVIEGSFEAIVLNDFVRQLQETHPGLTQYEVPKRIFAVAKFIETPTGKINKADTWAAIAPF